MAKIPEQVYRITFAQFDNLWIRITAPTIGEVTALTRMIRIRNIKPENLTESDIQEIETPQLIFARRLVEWNATKELEHPDGKIEVELPPTLAGVNDLPGDVFGVLLKEWMANTLEVRDTDPLAKRSQNGLRFPEASIPMELPSLNLPS